MNEDQHQKFEGDSASDAGDRPDDAGRRGRFSLWEHWMPVSVIGALVLLPVLVFSLPDERIKWRIAYAQELANNQNLTDSITQLESVVASQPEMRSAQWQLLQHLVENKQQAEALSKIDELDAAFADDLSWLFIRSNAYHDLGLHKEAYQSLQEWEQRRGRENDVLEGTATGINNLAYFAYLADEDIEVSFYRMEQMLLSSGEEAMFAVNLSQALRMVGRPEEAITIIDRARSKTEAAIQKEAALWKSWTSQWMADREWPDAEPDWLKGRRRVLASRKRVLGWLCEQGVRLGKDLQDSEVESRYRALLSETGFPSSPFEFSATPREVCQNLLQSAAFIDTRGILALRAGRWDDALEDLQAVVRCANLVSVLDQQVQIGNSPDLVDWRELQRFDKSVQRQKAVYFYHHSLLLQQLGLEEAAERERAMVTELGFTPNEALY